MGAYSDNDATRNRITYSLADDAGGRFAIDPVTGALTKVGTLILNTTSSYTVTVRATSADGSFSIAVFTINVVRVGDFDQDGNLDLEDVDALSAAIATGSTNSLFDTNGEGLVNPADLQNWILNIKRTVMGDANLDLVCDGSDFIIWNSHKISASNRWSQGNFNADNFIDGSDSNQWNSNKFTSGPGGLPPPTPDPEPTTNPS